MWRLVFAGVLGVVLGVEWGPVWVAFAAGGGVAVTALVTWLHGRRQTSGSVRTSEAGKLWDAYDRVMERVESDNASLREDNGKLRERVAVLEREVDRLEREVGQLRGNLGDRD